MTWRTKARAGLGLSPLIWLPLALPSDPIEAPDASGPLTVVSLNLARETRVDRITTALAADSVLRRSQILLFQEVASGGNKEDVAQAVGRHLGYFVLAVPSSADSPNQGLAVLSKFPLSNPTVIPLKRYNLGFHSRIRFAIAVTAQTPLGPLRIWNVHLDSRINPRDRQVQLAPVLEDTSRHTGLKLVGGDFNTTHFEWLRNMIPVRVGSAQRDGVQAAFEAAGFEPALPADQVTFPFLHQHLDWLFAAGLALRTSGTSEAPFSDHLAIWAATSPASH
ncbi:MAG: endonuclease/exonuclease/phosphatase family protein [Acidobacteriota bacterium]